MPRKPSARKAEAKPPSEPMIGPRSSSPYFENLIEGRIVHYVMPDGEHRPAIVVSLFRDQHDKESMQEGRCNLQVFIDGLNDLRQVTAVETLMLVWRKHIRNDPHFDIGTWHFIER